MLIVLSILMAIGLGILGHKLEPYLVEQFEEIEEFIKWPMYSLPLLNLIILLPNQKATSYLFSELGWRMIICILIYLAYFDFKYMILPTWIIYLGSAICLVVLGIEAILLNDFSFIINSIISGIVGYLLFMGIFYGSIYFLKKEGLGYGDVRIMGLIAMITGIEGLCLAMLIASVLAIICGVILYMIKGQSEAYSFGPFLCISAITMAMYEDSIMTIYMTYL